MAKEVKSGDDDRHGELGRVKSSGQGEVGGRGSRRT